MIKPMSNKIKKLKDKLSKTIWIDCIEKLEPHLCEVFLFRAFNLFISGGWE